MKCELYAISAYIHRIIHGSLTKIY